MPSGPTSSEAGLAFPIVMHAKTSIEPMVGHAGQHGHVLGTHRSRNGTNGLILFPSLTVQGEGLLVGIYIHTHHVALFSDQLG